jgi:hypothetical protein
MGFAQTGRFKAEGPQTTIVIHFPTKDIDKLRMQIRTHGVGMPKELTEFLKNVYTQFGT